jgi:hypothetical protein
MTRRARIALWTLCISAVATVAFVAFHYGRNVPFDKQWPLYDGLRQTAAIIFGVVGAWVAIVYPQALGKLLDATRTDHEDQQSLVRRLILPMIASTAILVFVLFSAPAYHIIRQIGIFKSHKETVQGASFVVVFLLTCIELWAILLALVQFDFAKRDVDEAREASRIANGLRSNV